MAGTFELTVEYADAVLRAQPFNGQVGARITAFARGSVTLEIPIRDVHRQQDGLVHGGVLSYAADNALTFAAGSVLGPALRTAGFTINYLRPAHDGILRARAMVVHSGTRQAVCTAELRVVHGETSAVCAIAQGTAVTTASHPRPA